MLLNKVFVLLAGINVLAYPFNLGASPIMVISVYLAGSGK